MAREPRYICDGCECDIGEKGAEGEEAPMLVTIGLGKADKSKFDGRECDIPDWLWENMIRAGHNRLDMCVGCFAKMVGANMVTKQMGTPRPMK